MTVGTTTRMNPGSRRFAVQRHHRPRSLQTRASLRDRPVLVVLSDGAVLAAHRAGPEDRRASDKMTVDVGIRRRRSERRERVALARRRRRRRLRELRVRMRVRVRVHDAGTSERGRRRRHRRRYRRLGAGCHHGDIRRRHRTRQCPGARQRAGVTRDVSHYVAGRAHGRRIVRPTGRIPDGGRCRAWVAVVTHVTAIVHLHAVEAYVVRRRRARVADVTRLGHCNIRQRQCDVQAISRGRQTQEDAVTLHTTKRIDDE